MPVFFVSVPTMFILIGSSLISFQKGKTTLKLDISQNKYYEVGLTVVVFPNELPTYINFGTYLQV